MLRSVEPQAASKMSSSVNGFAACVGFADVAVPFRNRSPLNLGCALEVDLDETRAMSHVQALKAAQPKRMKLCTEGHSHILTTSGKAERKLL